MHCMTFTRAAAAAGHTVVWMGVVIRLERLCGLSTYRGFYYGVSYLQACAASRKMMAYVMGVLISWTDGVFRQ